MRNRPERMPSNNGMSDDEDSDRDETPHGIREFNPAVASFPSTPYMFNYPDMNSTTFALTAIQCCGKKNGSTE